MTTESLLAQERSEREFPAGALQAADYYFLRGLATVQSITPPSSYTGDVWRLSFGDQVGALPLTGGRSLVIGPKLPIPEVVRLLAYALDVAPTVFKATVHTAHYGLVEIWIRALLQGIHVRLARGLYQDYVPVTERRWSARGRPDIKTSLLAPHRYDLAWKHTVLSRDLPENQLLLAALAVVCDFALQDPALHREARQLHRRFCGLVRPGPDPLGQAAQIRYHRLTEDYRPLHRLACSILRAQGPKLQDEDQERTAFLLDMPTLFEAYVTRALEKNLPPPYRVCAQLAIGIGGLGAPLRPDLVILGPDRSVRLILDVKYKSPGHRPGDLQQVLAYARLLHCDHVGLVFPQSLGEPTRVESSAVGDSGVRFTRIEMGLEETPEAAVKAFCFCLGLGGRTVGVAESCRTPEFL